MKITNKKYLHLKTQRWSINQNITDEKIELLKNYDQPTYTSRLNNLSYIL